MAGGVPGPQSQARITGVNKAPCCDLRPGLLASGLLVVVTAASCGGGATSKPASQTEHLPGASPRGEESELGPPHFFGSARLRPTALRGLKRIAIEVHADPRIPRALLPPHRPVAEHIALAVQEQLGAAGITSVPKERAEAILDIEMDLYCDAGGQFCGHYTEVTLSQWVRLRSDPDVLVTAITWQDAYSNKLDHSHYATTPSAFNVDVKTLVRLFVESYQKANQS